ncbi:MAG: hypothetical protein JXB46_01085 [Candidatus Eisenbacteria bacterium]|nr:hypothetical protein [Candidatus Eisenbacteria bacterium]
METATVMLRPVHRVFAPLLVGLAVLTLLTGGVWDGALGQEYPRLANIYFDSLEDADLDLLSRWDLLVLARRAEDLDTSELAALRTLNPDIVILAHFGVGYSRAYSNSPINADLTEALLENNWFMKDTAGDWVTLDDGAILLNMTLECPRDTQGQRLCEWLPEYIAERIVAGGRWDGVFMDYCVDRVAWLERYLENPIDHDLDGLPADGDVLNESWRSAMEVCVSRLRELVGEGVLLVGNGNNTLYDYCDGDTRENFPYMHGDWYENITNEEHGYLAFEQHYRHPTSNIINTIYHGEAGPDGPTGSDFTREFLFGFASTLVFGSGYYSCDSPGHSVAWWNEYYDIRLGRPLGRAEDAEAWPGRLLQGTGHTELIKKRRFESGIAVVNPTLWFQEIQLGGAYYDVHSWNGQFYEYSGLRTSVTVGMQTGEVLVGNGVLPASQIDGVRAATSRDAVTLTWEVVDGADHYSVYRATGDGAGGFGDKELVGVVAEAAFADHDVNAGTEYLYFVAPIDDVWCEGQQSRAIGVSTEPGSDLSKTLMVDEHDALLGLHQETPSVDEPMGRQSQSRVVTVWPQPARTEAMICFDASDDERWAGGDPIRLTIYDLAGRRVRRLVENPYGTGPQTIRWDLRNDVGSSVASGCYQCVLESGGVRRAAKVLVLR